jgi:hypothetical protein
MGLSQGAQPWKSGLGAIADRKAPGALSLLVRSDGQPLATFGTTEFDHAASTGGGHTGAEAMGSQATLIVRLVSAFHGQILSLPLAFLLDQGWCGLALVLTEQGTIPKPSGDSNSQVSFGY